MDRTFPSIMKQETFKQFRERVVHSEDDLFAILFLNFITARLAYIIVKYKIKITANAVTYTRMFLISPLIILLLLIAPIYNSRALYLTVLILSYLFLLSDWLDGQIARGLNKTSKKGAILDSIADRFSTIILLVLIFSIGMYSRSIIIILSSILLFALKCFHMMVITKLYYYKVADENNSKKIFNGVDATGKMGISSIFNKLKQLNKKIGLKKWGGNLGGSDRFFITVMLPIILILFGFYNETILLLLAFAIFLSIFFIIRIKNLFKEMII